MKSLLILCLLTLSLSGCGDRNRIDAEVFIKAETDCTLRGGLDYVTGVPSVSDSKMNWYYRAVCKDGSMVISEVSDS